MQKLGFDIFLFYLKLFCIKSSFKFKTKGTS